MTDPAAQREIKNLTEAISGVTEVTVCALCSRILGYVCHGMPVRLSPITRIEPYLLCVRCFVAPEAT